MKKNTIKSISVLFTLLLLTSCRVGPRHCVPVVEVTESWQNEDLSVSYSRPLEVGELFDDPLLYAYLEQLVTRNNDIKLASLKVCEAYALRNISAAKLLPFIDGRVAYNSSKPAGGILQPGSDDGGALSMIPLNIKQQTFLSDFDALWEIDLFGRRRREVESATAFIQMERASYHDVIVTLTAEFARTYLQLRKEQRSLELVRKEIDVLQEIILERRKRLNEGLESEFFLLDSEKNYEQLAAQAPLLEGEILSHIYHLSILLGKSPEALVSELSPEVMLPEIREAVPVGFPSDLLRRRPDIRFAERQIAKATADVGVAIADFFPKVTLTGNYGFQNLHLGGTRGEGESWGYGGNLLTPFFHGGSLWANFNRTKLIRMESFIAYEQTVLVALEESESAIARFLKSEESTKNRERGFLRSVQSLAHEQSLYDNGLANTLQLLERKQRAIQAERCWVISYVDTEIQLIALYKALGCGWENTPCQRVLNN